MNPWPAVLCCLFASQIVEVPAIRRVDFANFSYAYQHSWEPVEGFVWQFPDTGPKSRLVNGAWLHPENEGSPPRPALLIEEVVYGDLLGDETEEAAVILRYESGGTLFYHLVYVFGLDRGDVRTYALFRSGERSDHGLYRVGIRERRLEIGMFDPARSFAACCSNGILEYRFLWASGSFRQIGPARKGRPLFPSRPAVNAFGMPQPR